MDGCEEPSARVTRSGVVLLADGRLWRWAKESSMKFFSLPLSTRNLAGALLSWPWKIMRALPVALRWNVRQSRGGQVGAEG